MGRACSTDGEKMNATRKDATRKNNRWMDNIKMDLREVGWGGMDWIDQAQERDQ
jgi:hypothetical protein